MKFKANIATAILTMENNLKDHVVELKDASTTWIAQVTKELENMRDAVDRDGLKVASTKLVQLLHSRPIDNRADYAKLIGAMKVTQSAGETTIVMDEMDYDRVFNDNWDWRIHSKSANATYRSN